MGLTIRSSNSRQHRVITKMQQPRVVCLSVPDDVQWSIVELVKIRAENGDLQGAENSY